MKMEATLEYGHYKICHIDNSGYIAYIIAIRKCQGPGGPPGLQNQCTGDELVGGFDSHALPPIIISKAYTH